MPLPFTFSSDNGGATTLKAADDKDAYGWEIKSKTQSDNYLVVIHEWGRLNDYIKKESENLWQVLGNVNVAALDIYDNNVALTREDAAKYMKELSSERAEAIIKGAVAYAGPRARIYTKGWCFGGDWRLNQHARPLEEKHQNAVR